MRRLVTALFVLVLPAAAQDLASLLPADTPVYVEMACPTAREIEGLAMARVFDDPRMKALLQRARSEDSGVSSMRVPLGDVMVSLHTEMLTTEDVILDVSCKDPKGERSFRMRNRAALAVVGFPQGPCPVDGVLAFEVAGDPKEAILVIERIGAALSLASRGEEGDVDAEIAGLVQHAEHAGVSYSFADVGGVRICLAPVGKLVVLSTTEARMKDVLQRAAAPAAGSLATDPRHLAMLASVPGDGTAMTQIEIHVDRGLKKLEATYPGIAAIGRQMLLQCGLRDLESVVTVARVSGEGVRATTSVKLAPAEKRFGLGRLFEKGGPPPSYGGLAYAPADSLYVNCGNVDIPGLYAMVAELGSMHFAMAVSGPLERDYGFKIKEFFDLLGPEATLIVAPNRGLVPDVALVLDSKDAARAEASLVQLLSRVKWPEGQGPSEFTLRDVKVHAVPLGDPELGGIPLAPTFGVIDGRLVITPFPLSFQRVLAVKRGDRPSIEKSPEFQKLRGFVPADAQGLSYLDLVRIFELIYDTVVPFIQSMSGGSALQQLYEFPEVETLSGHLFGRVAWHTSDDNGLRWSSYSSMDTSSFTLTAVAAASAGLYFVRSAKEAPPLAEEPPAPLPGDDGRICLHRVRMLRARLQVYRKENGRLPGKIEDLEAKWVEPNAFVVPGTEGKRYVYLGPAGEGKVLLHGFPNGKDGLVSVLDVNLRAERVSSQELERRKAEPRGR